MGKVPRLVIVDCCSDRVLASTWLRLLPWRRTGGGPAYKGCYSAIADVRTPCCCLSPGSVKGGILLLPQCTGVHTTRAHVPDIKWSWKQFSFCDIVLGNVSQCDHGHVCLGTFPTWLGNVSHFLLARIRASAAACKRQPITWLRSA